MAKLATSSIRADQGIFTLEKHGQLNVSVRISKYGSSKKVILDYLIIWEYHFLDILSSLLTNRLLTKYETHNLMLISF